MLCVSSHHFLSFFLRFAQVELLDRATACQRLIIYLKTGTGKTFIAVMLIQRCADQICGAYSDGVSVKRTFFLANNVPLVNQQANYLREHISLQVGEYYGDLISSDGERLDFWNKETWERELEANHILVMTPQILVDLLNHSFISKFMECVRNIQNAFSILHCN